VSHFGKHDWYREAVLDTTISEVVGVGGSPRAGCVVYFRCTHPGCFGEEAKNYESSTQHKSEPEYVKRFFREKKIPFRDAQDEKRAQALSAANAADSESRIVHAQSGVFRRISCGLGWHASWWLVALTQEEVTKMLTGVHMKLEEACVYCGYTRLVKGAKVNREFVARQVGVPASAASSGAIE
jgi:hypothetical protein